MITEYKKIKEDIKSPARLCMGNFYYWFNDNVDVYVIDWKEAGRSKSEYGILTIEEFHIIKKEIEEKGYKMIEDLD